MSAILDTNYTPSKSAQTHKETHKKISKKKRSSTQPISHTHLREQVEIVEQPMNIIEYQMLSDDIIFDLNVLNITNYSDESLKMVEKTCDF